MHSKATLGCRIGRQTLWRSFYRQYNKKVSTTHDEISSTININIFGAAINVCHRRYHQLEY